MQFGVCGNLEMAAAAAEAGYDYAEGTVTTLLMPEKPEAEFCAALETHRTSALPYPAANCFVPGHLKVTGPEVDTPALQSFVATTMKRAEQAGIDTIVFGSGGARRVPDGFDADKAHGQLAAFCKDVGPVAADHGVTVVVEPLNKADCNVLTTVAECGELVKEVAHPAIRLLVDSYHMMRDGDSCDDIVRYGDLLAHVHIATKENRRPPGVEPCDLSPFFNALAQAGYDGRISIEGKIPEPATELPTALAVMRKG